MARNTVSRVSAPAKPIKLPRMSKDAQQQFKLARLENEYRREPEMWGLNEEEYQRIMAANRPGGSLASYLTSKLPTSAARDAARVVTHGFGQTGITLLKFLDAPSRLFGNRSRLRDIYEAAERGMAYDAFEDQSGVPQVAATAVHLASAGVMGRALPAVFGANVGMDTYEIAKATGASEGEALAKGIGHGAVDTAIWTLGQGLVSKYLPKAWQWLGREIIGAGRGAVSSVTSDALLNSLGANISGEEMARRAVHAAWMVPLLGMLKMGGKRREEAMALLRKARPDLAGAKADKVIEMIEAEFADPKSQKVALVWVARKGANLPDDTAQIKQALEVLSKVKGLDPMSRSPFEILSNPAYARYLPKPRPQDVKAFSNMKRYPMGVIGFDVSDDAAGRQATREMINAYMSPSSNPWCLATGKDAAKLGELGPNAETYWKGHSAVPKQIFFQEVDGKLELTAFRATSPGGEGRQEYWDTSDAGYSGIPLKVKVPGDPMGRYRKMVFRPEVFEYRELMSDGSFVTRSTPRTLGDLRDMIAGRKRAIELHKDSNDSRVREFADAQRKVLGEDEAKLKAMQESGLSDDSDVLGTFEDIAPGKIFKGDPFRDGRSQTWVVNPAKVNHRGSYDENLADRLRSDPEYSRLNREFADGRGSGEAVLARGREIRKAFDKEWNAAPQPVLIEDKVRTTENGITRFRTTKYADPTDRDYEPPKPGEASKPVEIEESELVSPEWMRARGYDPESESDVRRMQRDLDIQAWGNGAEAAMAVVPTKCTFVGVGKTGTPETVTYGPNGRDIVSVDFEENGVPYRETFIPVPENARQDFNFSGLYQGDYNDLPRPNYDYGSYYPILRRLVRNPGSVSEELLEDVGWNEELGSFVRTSGSRRWRMSGISEEEVREGLELLSRWINAQRSFEDASERFNSNLNDESLVQMYSQTFEAKAAARQAYRTWANQHPTLLDSYGSPYQPGSKHLLVEDRQPDGTWAPARDVLPNANAGTASLPPPPPATRMADTQVDRRRTTDEVDPAFLGLDPGEDAAWLRMEEGRAAPTAVPSFGRDPGYDGDAFDEDVSFGLKAGRTRRNVRAAEGGGDTSGSPSDAPIPSDNPAPAPTTGPRIVINPQVFKDKRDALCVTFNEGFRLVMSENGFEPVSEPTEKQRKFFADTAYANDELQLRRTILARIATLDTSVSDPTDEQLEETMEMLEMVMEVGAPQNEWEQQAVQRLHDVVAKTREASESRLPASA